MRLFLLLPEMLLVMLVFLCSICFAENVIDSEKKDGIQNVAGPPKIQFEEKVHDFGSVFQQETLKHTFIFRNTGLGTLRIKKVKAG